MRNAFGESMPAKTSAGAISKSSAGLATILNPALGYDRVAALVKEGLASGKNLKTLVLEKKLMDETALDQLLEKAFEPNLK